MAIDTQVQLVQEWLNNTYGSVAGWVPVNVTGVTGWNTIYGLRRGLQSELGISPVASGFGEATRAAFVSTIGSIDGASNTSQNLLRILSGALFCKGRRGAYKDSNETLYFADLAPGVASCMEDLGLQTVGSDPHYLNAMVDVKLMASLLSMDAYVIPFFGNGTAAVREVQQWLNREYSQRADFSLIPCDGIFSRQIQTALLYALQYEFGMPDGTANGNFGPGTRAGLANQAQVTLGNTDSTSNFVRLFQGALRFNGMDAPFTGSYDVGTTELVTAFQDFMEVPVSGSGDYTTWCTLLVSSGDTSLPTKGFDLNRQLTSAIASGARSAGYTHVGRYMAGIASNGVPKFISADEIDALRAAGVLLFPIHQRWNDGPEHMTFETGVTQGLEAAERGRTLGLPAGATIFFSVDFDPTGEAIKGPVKDYFEGVNSIMGKLFSYRYSVGVYGTRNVCTHMGEAGLSSASFVAGASTGYSGNMGFPMPKDWHYNQIVVDTPQVLAGQTVSIDRNVVSKRAAPVDLSVMQTPPRAAVDDGTPTGFDALFEWVCRAEVACEVAISRAGILTASPTHIMRTILHYLRMEKYWVHPYWKGYTYIALEVPAALSEACLQALGALQDPFPVTARDYGHFAASTLGYLSFGVPSEPTTYGIGDLGGWTLDLLSAWGSYLAQSGTPPLFDWMVQNVGIASDSTFGWNDLIADSDAYLMAHQSLGSSSGLSRLSRDLFTLSPADRVAEFYALRFGSNPDNVAVAFAEFADGLDAGPIQDVPTWLTDWAVLDVADADRLPTSTEAKTCGRAYAHVMATLGT